MQRTLGGDRLGSGKKMKVDLHGYERSTHDLSYLWRSTMSAGTLVPFMKKIGLPGDTFDIDLDCDIKTLPTIGPLFGSFKVQLDVFVAPLRLYNAVLHNNKLGIGLEMNKVYMPIVTYTNPANADFADIEDKDNCQINPSCILSYLGIRGIGIPDDTVSTERTFNITPLLAYWDIYKNYYANKQEELGAIIYNTAPNAGTLGAVTVNGVAMPDANGAYLGAITHEISIVNASGTVDLQYVLFETSQGTISAQNLGIDWYLELGTWYGRFNAPVYNQLTVYSVRKAGANDSVEVTPQVELFDLNNIDLLREAVLTNYSTTSPFNVTDWAGTAGEPLPYYPIVGTDTFESKLSSQEGLGLKTYQSDLFNNWLKSADINAINTQTRISTLGDSFTIDQLQLSKKVYDMLNRVAVSGGTYQDWIESVYDQEVYQQAETPMYMGGLIKELVFQEVVSNSQDLNQPLGTLAGQGRLTQKHKGGSVYIKIQEPSYVIGIISLTPRVDYSQGNDWDIHLQTFDDLHKPALDQIGFQDLIAEQMAWWTTGYNAGEDAYIQRSIGKQPAWLNYMTAVNKTYGNFAIPNKEMFMTLNRRYEYQGSGNFDNTSYIDPQKFNFIFAQQSLDAQNFWAQIAVNITARRKMSAKLMPNL